MQIIEAKIPINELRVGSYLSYKGMIPAKVIAMDKMSDIDEDKEGWIIDTMFKNPQGYTWLADYDPIPLTEEVLGKIGFEKQESGQTGDPDYILYLKEEGQQQNIIIVEGEYYVCGNHACDFYGVPVNLKYVHQLQNLCFSLTGKELIIKDWEKPFSFEFTSSGLELV